jgi:hypothetical protein
MKRRTLAPQVIVGLSVSCLAALLPFAACSLANASTSSPPDSLAPSPEKLERILAIDVRGFYGADVIVRTAAGDILALGVGIQEHPWRPPDGEYYAQDKPCRATAEGRIESVAGPIIDCRRVQMIGEWCPGPEASYAIDSVGNLWELFTPTLCYPILIPLSALIGALFLAAALTYVGVRYIADRRKAQHTPTNSIAA